MEKIIIPDKDLFEKKKKKILEEGAGKVSFFSDFDGTLTKSFVQGKKVPSIISLLRDGNYLSENYSKIAKEFYDKYHPVEIDPNISKEEKSKIMCEWWKKHFDWLIINGLNIDTIKKVVDDIIEKNTLEMKDYSEELLKLLYKKKIPLIVMSSGVGDLIQEFLLRKRIYFENVKIVANFFKFDKNGQVIGTKEPIIHSMNKKEFEIKNLDFYYEIEKRKNVILLGDKIEDIDMVGDFDYECLLKISFINENIEEQIERFKKNFDVVITKEESLKFVFDLIKKINP